MNSKVTFKTVVLLIVLISAFSSYSQKPTIIIQPFDNFSTLEAKTVYQKVKAIYPSTFLNPAIAFPKHSFYKPRNRYRADSIISYLRTKAIKEAVLIGLTNKDISATKNGIKDWGVMGLGYCPGSACVVSTYRLSKNKRSSQFYKIAIHELGHTQGLKHCPVNTCFMRDAEGGNPTDEETGFCTSCKTFLVRKGWLLK